MNPARREPLLWLQLLGLAALPLEILLLFLLFAGADPGPFPGFERLLTWAIGALGSAVLFWRLPPDLWSLLILQVPLRGRRPEQFRLSALQTALPLKVLIALGAALLLPLTWWADSHAGMAWAWSPLSSSPRLVVLLLCIPVLVLIQWQWAQVIQAIWMLTRPAALVDQTLPLTQVQAAEQRLNAGLPLLLLAPLAFAEPSAPVAPAPQEEQQQPETVASEPEQTASPAETETVAEESPEPAAEPLQAKPEAVEENEAHAASAEAVVSDDVEASPEEAEVSDPEPEADAEPEAEEVSSEVIAQDDSAPDETTAEAPQDESEDASVVDAGGAVAPEEKPEEG